MQRVWCIVLFVLIVHSCPHSWALEQTKSDKSPRNDRPIIGILAQEREDEETISFIAMTYVKMMESSGARVVPILVQQEEDYYKRIVDATNGLLFPGGNSNITSSTFQEAAQHLFRYATEANDRGDFYPIYGICQGFEITTLLILEQWSNNSNNYQLTDCVAEDVSLNLKFLSDPKSSRMFQDADDEVLSTLKTGNATPNYHRKCLTPNNVNSSGLYEHLKILTTSNDSHGLEFVSTFESTNKSRPIYLFQWHPEMILFEFKVIKGVQTHIKHTPATRKMVQYLSNFMVDESRKNPHRFPTIEAENEALIFNCNPIFTMSKIKGDVFEGDHVSQFYWFSSINGCDGSDPFLNYNVIIVGALSLLMALILIGVFVANWMYRRRDDSSSSSYVQIEEDHN